MKSGKDYVTVYSIKLLLLNISVAILLKEMAKILSELKKYKCCDSWSSPNEIHIAWQGI